jgi:SAM-dependent methyltransferase
MSIQDEIVACMAINGRDVLTQEIQTAHRLRLAEFWDIKPGDRILEIGCGQGDTTAVLAYLAGENGYVHAIDQASPDYGSPLTLGQAAAHLQQSKLGGRIRFEFGKDLLSPDADYPEHTYDIVVLSHCSWYFQSAGQLAAVLQKARRWGKKLCFAEWDTRITDTSQLPHVLAALIQAQIEAFKPDSNSNIRTLFTPADIRTLIAQAGWTVTAEDTIHSPLLQDGRWEVGFTLNESMQETAEVPGIPSKLTRLVQSQIRLLQEIATVESTPPMPTLLLVAE